MRSTNQRVARLDHDARQPRLAVKADVPANTKTRECTEGAAPAVQAMHGDIFLRTRFKPARPARPVLA